MESVPVVAVIVLYAVVVSESTFENDGNIEALLNHVLWEPTTNGSPTTEEEKILPYFDEPSTHVNITVQIGANVDLHCKVNRLNDKTVSWVRRAGDKMQLLSFGHHVYSTDQRYELLFKDPNDWQLRVSYVNERDAGHYECQVSTHPPIAFTVYLAIIVPQLEITDERGIQVKDKFYYVGSTIELKCYITKVPQPSQFIVWRHESTSLNYDTSRGGIRLSSSNNIEEIDTLQDTDSLTNSQSSSSSSNNSFTQPSQHNIIPRKRRRFLAHDNDTDRKCSPERTETIHKALAKFISMNQLPLSFCSSPGFYQFMAVVEPNYKIIKEEALKKRLHFFKSSIEEKIRSDLKAVQSVVCTSDCWSSLAQHSYITITAHALNNDWSPMSFTLTTQEMEERHTALNIADKLENVFSNWEIKDKVTTVITDNAKNVVNAVQLVSNTTNDNISDVTCAAHSLKLSINKALREDSISEILDQILKLVGHFKHSNLAKQSLLNKQKQLGMSETSLLQSCKTRWNSIFLMLERIFKNRCPISAVMADRSITSTHIAQKLEISEHQWLKIEALVILLKLFQVITSLLCGEKHSPTSMVRPLLKKLLDNHLKPQDNDDQSITYFKQTIIFDIKERFNLEWDSKSRVSV